MSATNLRELAMSAPSAYSRGPQRAAELIRADVYDAEGMALSIADLINSELRRHRWPRQSRERAECARRVSDLPQVKLYRGTSTPRSLASAPHLLSTLTMDPGTTIAVAQLTAKILQSLKKYASSVKDADAERTRLASQLTAIQCVLDNIKSHLSAGDGALGCKALSENLRVLLDDGGSIALYMATLRELMGELNEDSKKMRLRDKLLWPLREEKMKDLLQKIGHYRIHFIMVYSLLTSERLAEVASTVASISEEQIRLRREAEVREKRHELEEQEREHEKMKEDIVKWLDPVDNGLKHATVAESRQEGTCAWLFKHPTYLQWMEADHGLLIIHGTPGFGKTTLASSVIDHVRRGSHPIINYHYCDFREPASVDVTRILRTILAQAVRYLPSGTDELRNLSRRARDRKEHLASEEIMALLERFSIYCPSHLYLVDALDECVDPSSLLEKLHALSAVGGAHVLVTCRSEHRITELLEEGDFRLCLMDEHDAIEGDIERYVVSQLSRTVHFKHFPDDLKNDIAAQLLSNANSMFRWVQCQLETLRRCRSSYAVENTLRHLPTSLNETYERILKAIDRSDAHDQHIARRALQWLVGSFRTLTVWEINDALLIQFGESQLSRGAFFDVRDVLDACGSLVYCENDTVRLSHATVKEFLAQTPWLLSASVSGPCDSISDALHRSLAMQCLAYLLLDVFEDGPCHTQEELNDRACDYPMYEYAARLWNRHVALVDADDTALYRAVMALIWERETAGRRQAMCQVYYTGGSVGMHYMVPVPWFWAAVISQTWLAKRMFLENPDWLSIEQLDGFDFEDRPLATAVTYHSLQLVTTLLQFGADVDEDRTRSPISYAADILATTLMFKDLRRSIVKQLLDYKADVTLVPVIVLNALSYTGETDIVLRFLQHGYQREWVDPVDGETPVHYAAKGDQLNLIGKLLDAGYDMDLISAGGRSALHHSLARKLPNMAERLLSCGVATWTLSTALLRQLSWAEGQCWYPRLIAPFRTHTVRPDECIRKAYRALRCVGLPRDIVLRVLDIAEFWTCVCTSQTCPLVTDTGCLYIEATVPAGALRAITFLTKSYDTGYPRSQIEDCLSCFSPIPPKSYFRYEATVAHENVPLLELNVHEKPMEQALFSYTVDHCMTHEKARKWFHHLKAGQTVQLTAKVPGGPTKRYTHISYREIRFFCRFDI